MAASGDGDGGEDLSPLVSARRERVLDDVQELLAAEGVDVTMDQLADAAGIGRRTLFRYFPSREELIAAAVRRSYDQLLDEVFADPDPDLSAEQTVRDTLDRTHSVAERMGLAHWQVAADPESHGLLGDAVTARREARTRYVEQFVREVWSRAGRDDAPPGWLADTFALLESLFAYQALQRDLGRNRDQIVEVTSTAMVAALHEALRGAGAEPGGAA